MAASTLDHDAILQVVRQWPVSERVALADAILADARSSLQGTVQPAAVPSSMLRGILSNGQPAPSDEEVAHIVDEDRCQKYGT